MAKASALLDSFREFSRRYSRAERMHANARSTERSLERAEAALSMKQSLEAEFERCFAQIKMPNWPDVEAAARGDLEASS